jgi:hypothetical protein
VYCCCNKKKKPNFGDGANFQGKFDEVQNNDQGMEKMNLV